MFWLVHVFLGTDREEQIVWADTIKVGAGCWWLDQSMVKGCNQCQCWAQLDLRIRFWVGRHLNNLTDSKSNDARSKLLWWGNVNAAAYQCIHQALCKNLWKGISARLFSIRLRQYPAWFRTNLKKPLTRNLICVPTAPKLNSMVWEQIHTPRPWLISLYARYLNQSSGNLLAWHQIPTVPSNNLAIPGQTLMFIKGTRSWISLPVAAPVDDQSSISTLGSFTS